ncbi:MAG: ubiquinone biosynthesis protein COQ4 [Proteobacteria bacterium]|nr:ubiquinone biosynthesis protein COQ4 [Pseudomonadota bacterium]
MKAIDVYQIARATVRVLRDSSRTLEIFRVAELTGGPRYRRQLRALGEDPSMRRLLRERPEIGPEQVDFDALRLLSADTLGGAYVRHLDNHGLSISPELTATRFTDDVDVAYLIRRWRQTHDIVHTLLGVGTSGHEEVLVHAFSWGQLKLPVSAMIMFFGSIKHMLLERRWNALRRGLYQAYRSGRRAAPLLPVVWEDLWTEPIDAVRERFFIVPCNPANVHS